MSFSSLSHKLFIVATPIGNLKDITIRALEVLKDVDLILCEDTRVTNKLLTAYSINTKCAHFDDHTTLEKIDHYLQFIKDGGSIALVSDAGTPIISDPGYNLINRAKAQGITLEALPGPCSFVNALALSGFQSSNITFIGFLPHEQIAKHNILAKYQDHHTTLIFFESPHRLLSTLQSMQQLFPFARACVAREMTKKFEEITVGDCAVLITHYSHKPQVKGEIVVLIEIKATEYLNDEEIKGLLLSLFKDNFSLKDAVHELSSTYKISKKKLYALSLSLKQSLSEPNV